MRAVFPALLILLLPLARAEDRWTTQFFYDKPDAAFDIRDIACTNAQRCIAAGVISSLKGRDKGTIAQTSDAGQHWALEDFSETPVSLFVPKPGISARSWMVTEHGLWWSEEDGRSWQKGEGLKGIVQVYFLDDMHGYAVGYPKAVYETIDGGKKWTKLAVAATPGTKSDETIYDCIAFHGDDGVIVGHVLVDRNQPYPPWMTPNAARTRPQKRLPTIFLQTSDGGKNWHSALNGVLGQISEIRLLDGGYAVALEEYHDFFSLPSALLRTKLGEGLAHTLFAEPDRAVSDFTTLADGSALIATVEPPGNTNQVPIPGKLKMLRSTNWKLWEEMPVDYRAEARRATIAAPDAQNVWVATDTGRILKLESGAKR